MLVDWGQRFYIIREVARHPERGSPLLGTALILRTVGAALVAVPSGLAARALGFDALACWYSVVFIAVSLPFFLAQSYGLVFRARDRMDLDAWVSVANKIALLGLALVALALGREFTGVLVAQALAGFLALAIAARVYRRVMAPGPLRYSPQIAREVLVGGSAFFSFTVVSSIQPYIDVVILSKLAPAEVIGWYGAAKNIMGAMAAPAIILGTASFPRLVRAANGGPVQGGGRSRTAAHPFARRARSNWNHLIRRRCHCHRVPGQHFGPSGIILKVYAPGFFLLFVDVLFGSALFARGRAKAFAFPVVKVVSVVVGTALELVLIPIFQQSMDNGGIGVVAALVASEFVVFGGAIFLLRRDGLGPGISVNMAKVLGSAALTLLLFRWMPPLPILGWRSRVRNRVLTLLGWAQGLSGAPTFSCSGHFLREERSAPQTSRSLGHHGA